MSKPKRNYLPTAVPGTTRARTRQIIMNSNYGQAPTIAWLEEEQIVLSDGTMRYGPLMSLNDPTRPAPPLYMLVTLADLIAEFPIINLDTGEESGKTMSGAELLNALESFTVWKAKQRDVMETADSPLASPTDVTEPTDPTEPVLTRLNFRLNSIL